LTTSTYTSLCISQDSNPQRQLLKALVYHSATSAVTVMVTRVEGEWTAMAMATKRAMATKLREAGKEEGNSKGRKSNCNGKEDSDSK
jgi:hypothetical protein